MAYCKDGPIHRELRCQVMLLVIQEKGPGGGTPVPIDLQE